MGGGDFVLLLDKLRVLCDTALTSLPELVYRLSAIRDVFFLMG